MADWSFKLRSYVSVEDLQHGRMMEETDLAADANAWQTSVFAKQDMDDESRYLLIMLSSGSALQIIRQQPQAFRILARRYNPRSQPRSLVQLQELMHLEFGPEPAGVTDRLEVFERLVGDYEMSIGGVLGVQVKCAVLLEMFLLERRTHLMLICGSRPDDAIMSQTDWGATQQRDAHSSMGAAPMEIDGD